MSQKLIPLGIDNFRELVQGKFIFSDKSLMIKEFLSNGDRVTLITRPRRWGKTLSLSMLEHFFAEQVDDIPTKGIFDNLNIAKTGNWELIKSCQGKFPVIMLSFDEIYGREAIYMLTDCGPMAARLKRLGKMKTDLCRLCRNGEIENAKHLMMECVGVVGDSPAQLDNDMTTEEYIKRAGKITARLRKINRRELGVEN